MGYCSNCRYRESVEENSIFFNSPVCENKKKCREDFVSGKLIPRKCKDINGYGECLDYYPNGLEKPEVSFDENTNTVTLKGSNVMVYTLDGTEPTNKLEPVGKYDETEELYIAEIVLEHSAIVVAGCLLENVVSDTEKLLCEIPDVPSIDFDRETNTVTINSYNLTYYTTDGTDVIETVDEVDPETSEVTQKIIIHGEVYKKPFVIEENKTIKAVSYAREQYSEQVSKECKSVEPPVIEFNPDTNTVSITAEDDILFTTDGSDVYDDADEYTAPFVINQNTTVKAACIVDGTLSEQVELDCKVPTVPTITFNSATKTVTLNGNNTILYTTDGSDVKKKDTEYTGPFKITETSTIKAKEIVDNRLSEQAELECVVG